MWPPCARRRLASLLEGGGFAVGEDGGREIISKQSLPQSFASQNPAPSSEGDFGGIGVILLKSFDFSEKVAQNQE